MKLVLNIEPKPQSRPRLSKWGTYEDPKMKAWRRTATALIKSTYHGEFYESAIAVKVTFYMKAPQTIAKRPTPRAKVETWDKFKEFMAEKIWHARKPDVDNLIKAVLDSVTDSQAVWADDNIICSLQAKKFYSPNPRIELEVERINE